MRLFSLVGCPIFYEKEQILKLKSLIQKVNSKFWQIVVITITLVFTYYLLAVWGVILLIMALFAWMGRILRHEAI